MDYIKKYTLVMVLLISTAVAIAQTKPKSKSKEAAPTQKEMEQMMKAREGKPHTMTVPSCLTKEDVSQDRIIKEMNRGVTALHGRGMYLEQERDVLTVALTVTEVEHLKTIVREVDPHAFLTVMPAKEIVGEGFVPLSDAE